MSMSLWCARRRISSISPHGEEKSKLFKIACAQVGRIGAAPDNHIRECIVNSLKAKPISLHNIALITLLFTEPL